RPLLFLYCSPSTSRGKQKTSPESYTIACCLPSPNPSQFLRNTQKVEWKCTENDMDVTLRVLQGQPRGLCLPFPRGEFVFGCGPECQIRSTSSWVNRQHCLLRVAGDSVHLRDLGSSTGTLVNGVRLRGEQELAHGDQVQVGPLVLQVVLAAPGLAERARAEER